MSESAGALFGIILRFFARSFPIILVCAALNDAQAGKTERRRRRIEETKSRGAEEENE